MSDSADITPEWPVSLPVPTQSANYGQDTFAWETEMETRRKRVRPVSMAPNEELDVTWVFAADEYALFKEFFELELANGTRSFMVEIFGSNREMVFADANYSLEFDETQYVVRGKLEYLNLPAVLLVVSIEEVH